MRLRGREMAYRARNLDGRVEADSAMATFASRGVSMVNVKDGRWPGDTRVLPGSKMERAGRSRTGDGRDLVLPSIFRQILTPAPATGLSLGIQSR